MLAPLGSGQTPSCFSNQLRDSSLRPPCSFPSSPQEWVGWVGCGVGRSNESQRHRTSFRILKSSKCVLGTLHLPLSVPQSIPTYQDSLPLVAQGPTLPCSKFPCLLAGLIRAPLCSGFQILPLLQPKFPFLRCTSAKKAI